MTTVPDSIRAPYRPAKTPPVEVRCTGCSRLLMKTTSTGTALISIKCPRCGVIDTVKLSSG